MVPRPQGVAAVTFKSYARDEIARRRGALLRLLVVCGSLLRRQEGRIIVTLMQTFPGEAVLAVENARLFQEAGRARTAAETALVDLRRAIQDYDLPRRRLTHRTTMGGTVPI